MNYNEYDSNGNKKKIDFSSLFSDKTNRSRIILLLYLVLFVVLVIIIRSSTESNYKENNENKIDENTKNEEVIEKDNSDFSYLLLENYNFNFLVTINDNNYQIVGKRFNDKYEFELIDEKIIKYIGTYNDLYKKEEDNEEYVKSFLPVPMLNIFDNNLIKEIVNSSKKIDDYYEINNSDLNDIVSSSQCNASNTEKTNIIKLDIKNNKVVGLDIDFSNIANEWDEEITIAKAKLNYSNFGLIDDFSVNIE